MAEGGRDRELGQGRIHLHPERRVAADRLARPLEERLDRRVTDGFDHEPSLGASHDSDEPPYTGGAPPPKRPRLFPGPLVCDIVPGLPWCGPRRSANRPGVSAVLGTKLPPRRSA